MYHFNNTNLLGFKFLFVLLPSPPFLLGREAGAEELTVFES
jgi:hypothetical protein